jgi:hypothetical protein
MIKRIDKWLTKKRVKLIAGLIGSAITIYGIIACVCYFGVLPTLSIMAIVTGERILKLYR